MQLPKARPSTFVLARSDSSAATVAGSVLEVCALAGAESVTILRDEAAVPPGCALEIVSDALSVYMNLKGSVDARAEIDKLSKKLALLGRALEAMDKQAAAPDYEAKVPAQVRADNLEKAAKTCMEMAAVEKGIADFTALLA